MGRVNSKIPKSLLTTVGDIIAASAAGVPSRIAAPVSGQVFTGQGAGVLPVWAVSAVTRAGGNTVEATTTSITVVSLLSVASLSIATGVPIKAHAVIRKTTGAVATASGGLTLNATNVMAPIIWTASGNDARAGSWEIFTPARITNYDAGGYHIRSQADQPNAALAAFINAYQPIATITDVILRALVSDALVTMGADEMHVYTLAIS